MGNKISYLKTQIIKKPYDLILFSMQIPCIHVIIPLAFSHIHFNQWIFIYLITPSIFIMQCKKKISYTTYIIGNHRHNSCVKSNPKIMGTFVSCVWKKGQENWIFFSNKNGPERGRRIHAQCVQWFLASLHPTPTIYMYILCDVFQCIIQKSRKCGKKPSKYMSERYIYVCGCRP